jgi:hypothetical protein
MSAKTSFLKESHLIVIGRRYGSDAVAIEAAEAAARWARDEKALASYGFGAAARASFEADRAKHEGLRVSRSEAVADKKRSLLSRDDEVSRGWAWVDQVESLLGMVALTDEALAAEVAAAKPEDDAGLEAGVQALAKILDGSKAKLPQDAQVDARLSEVAPIVAAVGSSPGLVHTSKSQTVADTAQIDLFDGKLCVWIRELNKAGRRAIRNGHLQASRQEYTFHHLKRSGAPAAQPPAPAPKGTPAQTASVS